MKTALAGFVFFLIVVGLLVTGAIPKMQRKTALASEVKAVETGMPVVNTVILKVQDGQNELSLPASMQAIQEAPIYARIDGYLKIRGVDIGDHLKAGTVMAEIEAPEVDQQVAQVQATLAHAEAALAQAKAAQKQADTRMQLAKVTVDRWKQLVTKGVVSKQDGDDKQGAYDGAVADLDAAAANVTAAIADINAQKANLARMEQMRSFEKVVAPFDGVVTARNVDPGTLITAGSASDKRELFRMAKEGELRIFVQVPQSYSAAIHTGENAVIRVNEFQGKQFPGKIVRTSESLDPSTRTLLTEIHIPNPNHMLRPGMFSSVKFTLDRTVKSILAPAGVMLFNAAGPQVVIVRPDQKLHFQKVTPGRDYGSTIELVGGVNPGDQAVLNPTDDLSEGMKVEVKTGS